MEVIFVKASESDSTGCSAPLPLFLGLKPDIKVLGDLANDSFIFHIDRHSVSPDGATETRASVGTFGRAVLSGGPCCAIAADGQQRGYPQPIKSPSCSISFFRIGGGGRVFIRIVILTLQTSIVLPPAHARFFEPLAGLRRLTTTRGVTFR